MMNVYSRTEPAQLVEADGGARNVSVAAGAPARLACAATGDPPLVLQWTRRGRALPTPLYRHVQVHVTLSSYHVLNIMGTKLIDRSLLTNFIDNVCE